MSTLTKILIILLTLSSLFLCGYVVQYVSNVDNYKEQYEQTQQKLGQKENEIVSLNQNLIDERTKRFQLEEGNIKEIELLKAKITELEINVDSLERIKTELEVKVEGWRDITKTLTESTDEQMQLYKTTLLELNKTAGNLKLEKTKLDEVSDALIEKEALIDMLEADVRRLTEERTALENRVNRVLQLYGMRAVPQKPVTAQKDLARLATATTVKIGLKGLVTAIDTKNSMAKISIGKTDGVKKGMRFHVSRGSEYICDIVIIDIAAQEAVGLLELVQQVPRIGDNASTNW